MSLEEQIDGIVNTYIVCPDRGILSSSYREEATTRFRALIKTEKAEAVEELVKKVKKIIYEQAFYNPDAYATIRDINAKIDELLEDTNAKNSKAV